MNFRTTPNLKKQTVRLKQRPIRETDNPFLINLYWHSREAELATLTDWPLAQKITFIHSQWEQRMNHYRLMFPAATFNLLLSRTSRPPQPVGELFVNRTPETIHLISIALLPKFQGNGLGSHLIRGLQTEAERNQQTVSLTVYSQNHAAQRLYRRLGFREVEATAANSYISLVW